jgi:hypothetical protein
MDKQKMGEVAAFPSTIHANNTTPERSPRHLQVDGIHSRSLSCPPSITRLRLVKGVNYFWPH